MVDIEEDWALLRGRSNEIVTAPAEVEGEWNTIRGLPEWIYTVHEGYGVNSMALWRLKPKGHRKGVMPGNGSRVEEFWTYWHDTLLWSGSLYKVHESCTSGRSFRTSTKQVCLTLDEAFARLEAFKQKHMNALRESVLRHEAEIRERQSWIGMHHEDLRAAESLRFDKTLLR